MAEKGKTHVAVNGYGVIGKCVADMLRVQWDEVFYAYMVDNQAIVIPETIDAIRALTGLESDGAKAIKRTDPALGIGGPLLKAGAR